MRAEIFGQKTVVVKESLRAKDLHGNIQYEQINSNPHFKEQKKFLEGEFTALNAKITAETAAQTAALEGKIDRATDKLVQQFYPPKAGIKSMSNYARRLRNDTKIYTKIIKI